MRKDWAKCTFEDLLDYEQPTNYIIKEEDYNDKYPTPVLTAGKGFIKGYTKEGFGIFNKLPAIIFDDFTTSSHFVNFTFKVKSSAMKILLPKSDLVNLKFVFGAMKVNKVRSETHKRYWISEYAKIIFSLPPLPEQRAIVKKVEKLFSDLDAAIADLKKTQEQLKIYRQAVLKKAFEGGLKESKLGMIGEAVDPQPSHRTPPIDLGGVPYVSIKDVVGGSINLSSARLVPKRVLDEHLERYQLKDGDFIIGKIGTIGNPVKVKLPQVYTLSANVVLIQPRKINSDYLYYFFKSNYIEQQFNSGKKATTQSAFGIQKVRELIVRHPESTEQQHQIVREIESRLSVCDVVEAQITASLDKAEALRQSILKKAFAGELLSQAELEACHCEPDYEPAAVLLEKIKAEKAHGKPQTGKQQKKQIPVAASVVAMPKISADIQAGLIAKVIHLHEHHPEQHHLLSHIKCEKLSHLVESHLQIPLGRQPVKDAAGPDDYPRLKKVEHRAKMAGYFAVQKNKIGHTYLSGKNLGTAISKFESGLSADQKNRVNQLLALFLKFDLEQAEIVATVYAAWNNLIITGNTHPTEVEIVQEARYNWSDRKLTLEESRFYNAIQWMQKEDVNLIPVGYGAYVDFPKKKK